jgi:hypothetical protein
MANFFVQQHIDDLLTSNTLTDAQSILGIPGESLSGNWERTYTFVKSSSAGWNNSTSLVQSNSSIWNQNTGTINSILISNSASWDGSTSLVQSNSSIWNLNNGVINSIVISNSGNWNNTHAYVASTSANSLQTVTNYLSTNNVILSSATILNTLSARAYVNNPTGKTIYVDAATGTDTRTGLSKYDQFKPYATLSAAAAASATGDLIYVRAGTYAINSQINLNDKGHLYFEPGATVNITNNVTAFSFNQATNNSPTANSIRIQGSADFVLTGSAGILTIPASINTFSPPIVAFECNSITGPDAANGTLFRIMNGALSVDAKTIAMTTTFTASSATVFYIGVTGVVTARIPFVYCGKFISSFGMPFPGSAVRAQINADIWTLVTYNTGSGMDLRLITTSFRIVNYNHVGVGAALDWTENATFEYHGFRGITWGSLAGKPHITFASMAASTTNKIIRLDQTNIMRYATTNSLSSNVPINVATYGTFASVSATPNITFKVGSFTVNAEVNAY